MRRRWLISLSMFFFLGAVSSNAVELTVSGAVSVPFPHVKQKKVEWRVRTVGEWVQFSCPGMQNIDVQCENGRVVQILTWKPSPGGPVPFKVVNPDMIRGELKNELVPYYAVLNYLDKTKTRGIKTSDTIWQIKVINRGLQ